MLVFLSPIRIRRYMKDRTVMAERSWSALVNVGEGYGSSFI
jgi:hypothetical protein